MKPTLILIHFGQNHGLSQLRLFHALSEVRSGDRLQVVDVVEEDALQLVDRRVYVAGYRDVNKEHGPTPALLQKVLRVLTTKNWLGRTGGGNDDVGLVRAGVDVVEADGLPPEALGQLLRTFVAAVGNQHRPGALIHQMASGLFAHFARTYQQTLFVLERAENLPRQLH